MTKVRQMEPSDVDNVVVRIAEQLAADARAHPLINPVVDPSLLASSLHAALESTWVAQENGHIVGHLYGAVLESDLYGRGVWTGPDGASFESVDVLSELYAVAGQSWIDQAALEQYVWTLDGSLSSHAWYDMGFARMHVRGVMALTERRTSELTRGYVIRRGDRDDLDLAVALEAILDEAQRRGPSFSLVVAGATARDELDETLSDPDTHHYLVEFEGRGIAQCITFPLPPRRGSFDHTLHLSAVSVLPEHQNQGVATAMVNRALSDGAIAGFRFAETNWRITNRRAQSYWLDYGFHPTYLRLHRTIGHG